MEELVKVKSALDEFIGVFQHNPFEFLYESDIKARLSCILHKKFSSVEDQITMETIKSGPKFFSGKSVTFSPAKTEYPKGRKLCLFTKYFDIVVIDKGKITDNTHLINLTKNKNELFWNRKVKVAIEIKLCQLGQNFKDKCNEMEEDVCKIRKYRETILKDKSLIGLALLFVQSDGPILDKELPNWEEGFSFLKQGITKLIITNVKIMSQYYQ